MPRPRSGSRKRRSKSGDRRGSRSADKYRKSSKSHKGRSKSRRKAGKRASKGQNRKKSPDSYSSGSGTSRTFPSDEGNESPLSTAPNSPKSPLARDLSFSQGLDTGYAFPAEKNVLEVPIQKRLITPDKLITRKVMWKVRADDEGASEHMQSIEKYKVQSKEQRMALVRELVHLKALLSSVEVEPSIPSRRGTSRKQKPQSKLVIRNTFIFHNFYIAHLLVCGFSCSSSVNHPFRCGPCISSPFHLHTFTLVFPFHFSSVISRLADLAANPPGIQLADLDMQAYKDMRWLHETRVGVPEGASMEDEGQWWRTQTVHLEEADR